jgi:DNA-binding transcriptional LysR family regulator
MTLVQLRHFVALAAHGSFSRAATQVHLSQPAFSRSVQALEGELGLKLFDRVGHRIELTSQGQGLLQQARQIVLDADDIRQRAQQSRLQPAGLLRVGMGSGPGALLMRPLLERVAEAAASGGGLKVEITRSSTELLVQSLRQRRLDALVVDARSLAPAADLKAEFVHELRGAFLVRRGHPLARRRKALRFADLLAYPIATTPLSDEVARQLVEHYGPQANLDVFISLRCDELSSLVEITRDGDTVLLAVRAVAPDLAELKLDPPLSTTARFGLVTLARRSEPPALALLRELMDRCLRD